MREKRIHPRLPLRLEARWNGSNTPCVTSDVSKGGCYVESIAQVAVGDIRLQLELAPGQLVELEGEVRYVHPTIGFGVRFRHLTDVQLHMLLQLLGSARANQNLSRQDLSMVNCGPMRVAA